MNGKYINEDSGFTLIEMIMALTIMVILVAMIAPNFLAYYDEANKASDVQTAAVLGESLENILIFDEKAASEWQNFENKSYIRFDIRDYYGNKYRMFNAIEFSMIQWTAATPKDGRIRDATLGWCKTISDDLQLEVQQSGITMHYRAHENDLMRICKNEDSGRVEVWVGGAGEGRNCKIYYRLYPDPDPRYMSSDYTYRPRFGGRKQNNSTNIDEIDGWNAYDKNGNPIKNK
ncbi:MAG: type II secretion system protein [Lachnospiraceae bacterium]|nr:type II secretion system protein [Lachnospiraceae bacterium]